MYHELAYLGMSKRQYNFVISESHKDKTWNIYVTFTK